MKDDIFSTVAIDAMMQATLLGKKLKRLAELSQTPEDAGLIVKAATHVHDAVKSLAAMKRFIIIDGNDVARETLKVYVALVWLRDEQPSLNDFRERIEDGPRMLEVVFNFGLVMLLQNNKLVLSAMGHKWVKDHEPMLTDGNGQ